MSSQRHPHVYSQAWLRFNPSSAQNLLEFKILLALSPYCLIYFSMSILQVLIQKAPTHTPPVLILLALPLVESKQLSFASTISERVVVESTRQLISTSFALSRDLHFLLHALIRIGPEVPLTFQTITDAVYPHCQTLHLSANTLMNKLLPTSRQLVKSYFLLKWLGLREYVADERSGYDHFLSDDRPHHKLGRNIFIVFAI